MLVIELDDFVNGLQMSVAKAQANIASANRGCLERLIELDRSGQAEALTWSFVIDEDSGSGRPTRNIRLPLITLRPHLSAEVSEFKFELKAAIVKSRSLHRRAGQCRLRLILQRHTGRLGRRLHNLTISLCGPQPGKGEVAVDGVPLKMLRAPD